MATQMQTLTQYGQSIWLDNIRRSMFASGDLRRLIDQGLRGMTSNPTIFEKAIGSGSDYDEQLGSLAGKQTDPGALFEALAIQDIRSACDEFRALFDSTHGGDGYVSLEVSPTLAHDTQGTIDAAARLWKAVDRPNVMIKIPGTPEGVPAIRATIAAGINVNVTLLFSVDRYEAAAQAYIDGINDRVKKGEPVDKIASVASVFISRIDTAVDKLLDARIQKGETALGALSGKTGIANCKIMYQRFLKLFEGPAFSEARTSKGAHVQRPLWASTGTKNPAYSDLMYVEGLVAKDTVNTVPPQTLDALLDHGKVQPDTAEADLDAAHAALDGLAKAGISLYDITEALVADGVKSFADSFNSMLETIAEKQRKLVQGTPKQEAVSLGKSEADAVAELHALASSNFLSKLWKHDPAPWSAKTAHIATVKSALGWLDVAERVTASASELREFAATCAKRFTHVVVLGAGGSALTPAVLRETFGTVAGFPELHVLDTTDPLAVKALEATIDIATTGFIVASKSGTTTEPAAFLRYFYERVQKTVGAEAAGRHFIAVTDPGTPLEAAAKSNGFMKIWINDPTIGGRFCALSYFGMLPAAMAGFDLGALLKSATAAMNAHVPGVDVESAPGLRLGAALGALAKRGRDKLTLVTHPALGGIGEWIEQLIAQSTGKSGTGIVPVAGEPLGAPQAYGDDRVFVYVGAGLTGADAADEVRLDALEAAGQPVLRLAMNARTDIAGMFYLWEVAAAAAGSILEIDAFDQPDVGVSQAATLRLLAEAERLGTFADRPAQLTAGDVRVTALSGSPGCAVQTSLEAAVGAIVAQIRPGDYVSLCAYIAPTQAHRAALAALRVKLRDAYGVATTAGFGPRFLHSTGQLHAGGPDSGIFVQITGDGPFDVPVPGMAGFRTIERAQALGDFEALDRAGRRGARVHFAADLTTGLRRLAQAVDDALTVNV